MKELINIIVQKTGISQENAQQAVQVTLGFLKTKLPTPVAAQLDTFLRYATHRRESGSGRRQRLS